jgi:hypothetical protein
LKKSSAKNFWESLHGIFERLPAERSKSFLLLFFKKEVLSWNRFLHPITLPERAAFLAGRATPCQ